MLSSVQCYLILDCEQLRTLRYKSLNQMHYKKDHEKRCVGWKYLHVMWLYQKEILIFTGLIYITKKISNYLKNLKRINVKSIYYTIVYFYLVYYIIYRQKGILRLVVNNSSSFQRGGGGRRELNRGSSFWHHVFLEMVPNPVTAWYFMQLTYLHTVFVIGMFILCWYSAEYSCKCVYLRLFERKNIREININHEYIVSIIVHFKHTF